MTKITEHFIDLYESGANPDELNHVHVKPASEEAIKHVLATDENDSDGRSQFVWVTLPNGAKILGVFPQGDTYFAVEDDY